MTQDINHQQDQQVANTVNEDQVSPRTRDALTAQALRDYITQLEAQNAELLEEVADLRINHQQVGRFVTKMTEQARESLRHPLTGLYNKRTFQRNLERSAARVQHGSESTFALLLLDVNGLKRLNDGVGHQAGDELLTVVAKTLQDSARAGDTAYHIGGDEMAMLLPVHGNEVADPAETEYSIARRYRSQITAAIAERALSTNDLHLGVSVGVGLMSEQETADSLYRRVDAQLYADKAAQKADLEQQGVSFSDPRQQ